MTRHRRTARPAGENCSDLGNARRLVTRHGRDLRYVGAWGWLAWDGRRWRRDDTGEAERRAKDTARSIYREADAEADDTRRQSLARHALASERAGAVTAMLALARSEPEIAARPDEFDQDPFLLTVLNGTVNLRTGTLRAHAREDLITRLAPVEYDVDALCPRWLAYLKRVMDNRDDLIEFLARAVGYSLSGDTREQCLFFLYGTGANGKGTTVRTLEAALGEYFRQADFSSFLERRTDVVREDLADLAGARLVAASETGDGRRMAEGLIKTITGQDTISARFLHRDRFTFRPSFKLWLVANEKPDVRGTDDGIWRRIHLIPFDITIPREEWDMTLEPTLQGPELPGILAWALRGCQGWLSDGLCVPPAVRTATQAYRSEMDVVGRFLDEQCVPQPNVTESAAALYARFKETASRNEVLTATRFGRELARRGFGRLRDSRGAVRRIGLRLVPQGGAEQSEQSEVVSGNLSYTRSRENNPKTTSDCSDCSGPDLGPEQSIGRLDEVVTVDEERLAIQAEGAA